MDLPCDLWNFMSSLILMSDTPSPYVSIKGSSPIKSLARLTLPPVMVLIPVSNNVIFQASKGLLCTWIAPSDMSIVTSL